MRRRGRSPGFFAPPSAQLELWLERRKQRRALLDLNDALLKDIGVSRADAYREGTKHFWQA